MQAELLEERDLDLQPEKDLNSDVGLAAVIDRVLDKGLVINADIIVTVGDAELLGIKIRAALASFETAAQFVHSSQSLFNLYQALRLKDLTPCRHLHHFSNIQNSTD